jgi:aryl-alcohol dehydrogenase-like predicted oxidoreductase
LRYGGVPGVARPVAHIVQGANANEDRRRLTPFDLDRICVETYYCYEENFMRLESAGALAREKGLTVPQVALAYTLDQPLEIFVLLVCNTGDEFGANIEAGAVELIPEELSRLENGPSLQQEQASSA